MANEDKKLIESAQADKNAFSTLYNKYVNKIYSFIYYRVNNETETASDLTAEVFTRAIKTIDAFTWQGYPYSSYLYQIARSVCQEHYKEKNIVNIDDVTVKDNNYVTMEAQSDLNILWEKICTLEEPLPEVFELKYKDGLSYEEIAEIIGKKPGALRTAVSRAINNLKEQFLYVE